MLYSLARPVLFGMDPEAAHALALASLKLIERVGMASLLADAGPARSVKLMGLEFPNALGLAAGLDKNGEYIDALAAMGFGFIEIGTVTPRPQPGNPKPRMFRLPEAQALINRLGFNNHGVERLLANVARARYRGVLGINIGKNFDTPIERAADDYEFCLAKVYAHASYVTVNVSSPNTKDLRRLQSADELGALAGKLKTEQMRLADAHGRYVPLLLKIAPDLDDAQLGSITRCLLKHKLDGVIATNTTVSRAAVAGLRHAEESGGLSGAPLGAASTEIIRKLARLLDGKLPIIGVGGVMSADDARAKLRAGASLVQIYTGFIYRGPELIGEILRAMSAAAP
ncbi:MAG: dihydroorotate dehydrogenase (quinone) [Betaproteobacteria bacterium RIFCSPLOWO2_12_FULL_62_13b]|nr:MAG: dihydroorotate dehydrogenase (quinone) [Betaproteobacteria bacterium RIFCSPLOWO2_12_FULL_62_13b]